MKRIIVMLILSLLLLLGCGNRQSNEVLTVINPFPENASSFERYVANFETDTGIEVEIHAPNGGQTVNELIEEMILKNNAPDIFPIAGYSDFLTHQEMMYYFQNDKWIDETDLEYEQEGIVYGFPITIEGSGIIANTEYIEAVGIDYTTINSPTEFMELVVLLDENKEELGYSSVFGISFEESSDDIKILVDMLLNGQSPEDIAAYFSGNIDALDLTNYPGYVDMLMTYSSKKDFFAPSETIEQNFANGEYVFILGTSTVAKSLQNYGMDIENVDILPGVYNELSSDRITLVIPYYWCINKYGDVEEARLFLNNLVFTPYGKIYLSEDTSFMPPFIGMDYETTRINDSISQYYSSKHFSLGYINGSNEYLSEVFETLFVEYYYFRDYDAFITELENVSIDISTTLGRIN